MYNVILCDDNLKDRKNVESIVKKFFNKMDIKYRLHIYSDYDSEFDLIVKSSLPFKIYLLDIETPSRSGIDIARDIRKTDVNSVIMFLTAHEELGNVLLKDDLMFLSFINKFDDLENRLNKCLYKSLQIYKQKNAIKLVEKNIEYNINLDDILYVTKDSVERKTIIVTTYGDIKTYRSLNEVMKILDKRFIQTHRACYVNNDKILSVDKTNKIIKLSNNTEIDLLSDRYKKKV